MLVKQLGRLGGMLVDQMAGVGIQVCLSVKPLAKVGRYVGWSNGWGRCVCWSVQWLGLIGRYVGRTNGWGR